MCLVASFALLGVFAAARGADTREVKLGRSEIRALNDLSRQAGEIEAASKQVEDAIKKIREASAKLQADTAQIHSEIRARFGVSDDEDFRSVDADKGILIVGTRAHVAPAGTR
jgi:hypothetical protein